MDVVTIVGTGAMALYFGGRLAGAGVPVRFLGTWKAGLTAIQEYGIHLLVGDENSSYSAQATSDVSLLSPSDLVLVLVKSWQTSRAANQLSRILSPTGIALTLQNGLGNVEILREKLGPERVAQGVTTYGATLLGPGRVRSGGEGTVTVQEHPRLAFFIDLLRMADITVQETDEISSLAWGKLVINVGINPLTALLGVSNGRLLDSPEASQLMTLAAEEAANLANRQGIALDYDDPAQAVEAVARATAQNLSSMLQDIRRGAPTEIEALCGEVIRRSAPFDLPTPVNQLLYQLIKAKVELQRNSKDEDSYHNT
jgi:2-dehydropantoate 2-reductase